MWSPENKKILQGLKTPILIQGFLDSIDYNPDPVCNSPVKVIKNRKAHCFEGALFASAALRFNGDEPLIVDLRAENDDDHVIAVYRRNNCWGAIAKSNFTTLRYREPVYRSLRELVMSYFDFYFNTNGDKSLRSYTRSLNLKVFDHMNWEFTDNDLEFIGDKLNEMHHYEIMAAGAKNKLHRVPDYMLQAGMLGSNPDGLFKPG